ncbi:MAG: hypothetical protein DWQ07_03740 [Chloroflexi bacterium]|nr:MAG: hypothetical protein DWQ07_03740 [Chloroflexota bacterium]MBL1193385.1 hypothetical protein [Chloroflexota bacterium]NOH10677.1 hypothetical protein [Chloroflexota bacterium]
MIETGLGFLRSSLIILNQIFEAGIAITAVSLALRAFTFNLRNRVARSFAVILTCVMMIYSGESLSSVMTDELWIEFWLRMQWLGLVYLPAAYLHFADALLATTGRPSRGRRRLSIRIAYFISTLFLIALPSYTLIGPVVTDTAPLLPYLQRTPLTWVFTFYYFLIIVLSGTILWRSYKRTVLTSSRRRSLYLMGGAFALALGSYPYLLLGTGLAEFIPTVFLISAAGGSLLVFIALIAMAYAVAFFGVAWPDRVVRSRLFKWLLRGPVTVFAALVLMTVLRQVGLLFEWDSFIAISLVSILTVLFLEHVITIAAPVWERWFFHGGERDDVRLVQRLEERLITSSDLSQFLEAVLAAVCDQFQVNTAFVAALGDQAPELIVRVGDKLLPESDLSQNLLEEVAARNGNQGIFAWGEYWLLPLYETPENELLGLLGIWRGDDEELDEALREPLYLLGRRAALALEDRRLQRQVFAAVETLNPKVDLIQRLRAAASFDQNEVFSDLENVRETDLSGWVKDALSHYWGGPKLTTSPLMNLRIVQAAMREHDGNPTNALRAILKEAIERVRPAGERRFTGEWILYNILELKFMEGRKVREVALRLAMSEADLYRKQRVAIEEVAGAILDMERAAQDGTYLLEEETVHEV